MRLVDLAGVERLSVDRFGSRGVDLVPLVVSESGVAAVDIAYIEPGGILGQHAAPIGQLFVVMSGSGWVRGSDVVRYPAVPGRAPSGNPARSTLPAATRV